MRALSRARSTWQFPLPSQKQRVTRAHAVTRCKVPVEARMGGSLRGPLSQVHLPGRDGVPTSQSPQSNNNFCLVWLEVGGSAWSGIGGECSGMAALEQSLARDMFCQTATALGRVGATAILPMVEENPHCPCHQSVLICLLPVLPLGSWVPASWERSSVLEVKDEGVSERRQPKPCVPAHETQAVSVHPRNE